MATRDLSSVMVMESIQAVWATRVLVMIFLYGFYRFMFRAKYLKSKDYHDFNSPQYKALRSKVFFPGFSNGWHAVCNSKDIENGAVKSISALGTHMVAFRGENGKAGVLHAFCPHLGAHLGQGGVVDADKLLVCPFHNWSFDTQGKCKKIPYMKSGGGPCNNQPSDRTSTVAYPTRELLGVIYVWFHAEEKHKQEPLYELNAFEDLVRGIKDKTWYFAVMRNSEFAQHSCEMAMNSADQHHFDTLHSPFPIPVVEKFVTGVHKIRAEYETGIIHGEKVDGKHLTLFLEKTEGLYFFGNRSLPVPFSEYMSSKVMTSVVFEGPTIVHFILETPFGKIRQVMTLLSVEPFKQYMESRWYAENSVPYWVVNFISYIGSKALEQDRQVWESKMFHLKPQMVHGDGPFPAFIRWYGQFYSEHSKELEKASFEW